MGEGADSGQVASQTFGYRRGFVLGLTLAEAALLLVFVILLLMVAGFERRDRVIAALGSLQSLLAESAPAGVDPARYAEEQLAALAELREAAQSAGHDWDDDFIELVRAIVESASASDLVDASKALQDKQDQLDRMLEALGDVEGAKAMEQLLERLADSEARLSNQHGQLVALRDRLERSGQGGVLPSCWMTLRAGSITCSTWSWPATGYGCAKAFLKAAAPSATACRCRLFQPGALIRRGSSRP